MLPEAKVYTTNPELYFQVSMLLATVFRDLDRYQEAHEAATDAVVFAKAKYGPEDPAALTAVKQYAFTCAKLGRVEEAKTNFEDVLTIQTRVLGREHDDTQNTMDCMRSYGFAEPSG